MNEVCVVYLHDERWMHFRNVQIAESISNVISAHVVDAAERLRTLCRAEKEIKFVSRIVLNSHFSCKFEHTLFTHTHTTEQHDTQLKAIHEHLFFEQEETEKKTNCNRSQSSRGFLRTLFSYSVFFCRSFRVLRIVGMVKCWNFVYCFSFNFISWHPTQQSRAIESTRSVISIYFLLHSIWQRSIFESATTQ